MENKEYNYEERYNVSRLAIKDPFEIARIDFLKEKYLFTYYAGIVSETILGMIGNMKGFERSTHRAFNRNTFSEYYFRGNQSPEAVQWTCCFDQPAGKLKKGDLAVSTDNSQIKDLSRRVMDSFEEIARSNYVPIDESELKVDDLAMMKLGAVSTLKYYSGEKKYFFHEYHFKDFKSRCIKLLR